MSNGVVQMTIRLEPEFHAVCLAKAEEAGQTLAEWIRRAMKEKIEREDDKDEYCLPNGESVVTKENLIEALRELKKEGFSFENL